MLVTKRKRNERLCYFCFVVKQKSEKIPSLKCVIAIKMFKLRVCGDETFLLDTEKETAKAAVIHLFGRIGRLGSLSNISLRPSENISRTTRHVALRYPQIEISTEQLRNLDPWLIERLVQQMHNHDWNKPMDIAICRTETNPESGKRFSCMSKCIIKRARVRDLEIENQRGS